MSYYELVSSLCSTRFPFAREVDIVKSLYDIVKNKYHCQYAIKTKHFHKSNTSVRLVKKTILMERTKLFSLIWYFFRKKKSSESIRRYLSDELYDVLSAVYAKFLYNTVNK